MNEKELHSGFEELAQDELMIVNGGASFFTDLINSAMGMFTLAVQSIADMFAAWEPGTGSHGFLSILLISPFGPPIGETYNF
ncbi:MAG: hypothetical protein LBT44_01555 [Clostridiales bacterium]|jgi:hypothetical protein|nr:hypothetical protein [Clostridiales bacterium]